MDDLNGSKTQPKRILIATMGSLGDLHPCLGLGLELQRRGHKVTIAATEFYRAKVEGFGLNFRAMRPDWDPTDGEIIAKCEDLKRGFEVLLRELVFPHLPVMYEDLLAAAREADLMIVGEILFAAPLVAEKLGVRWASLILSPLSFLSAYDPSVVPNAPWLMHMRKAGPWAYRTMGSLLGLALRHWWNPIRELRRELGLREQCDPVRRDKFSPHLVLALFSSSLAQPQPDWPAQTVQPGFVFHDRQSGDADLSAELAQFLAAGEAPIVFTQGSAAVHHPGEFYPSSADAARRLGKRAVLVGAAPELSSPGILALRYAPYSEIFPHASVIVHQGGSGTTGQAMRAGRPMLIVPYGWDQPDNGARVERIGVGLSLPRAKYTAATAASLLQRLIAEPRFAAQAASVATRVREEDGLTSACNAIEKVLG
jgi:rhamnosyltransferase subunit B